MSAFIAPVCCAKPARSISTSTPVFKEVPVTLFSLPVSCFAARARLVAYSKGLDENQIEVVSPALLGGMKSPEYLAVSTLGKVPAAIVREEDGTTISIFESAIIVQYLIDRFVHMGPSFEPKSRTERSRGRLVAALLDTYVTPLHPFMYKKLEPGVDRNKGAAQMKPFFDAIEKSLDNTGPFVGGTEISIGDCALWGNLPFYEFMLPTFFGWSITDGRPKLTRWIAYFGQSSPHAKKVHEEVYRGLEKWWDKGRWEDLGMKALRNPKRFT